MSAYVAAGLTGGAALASKYSAAFLVVPFIAAHWLAPTRPPVRGPVRDWIHWLARGLVPLGIGAAVFFATNPLILMYPDKFQSDVREWILATNFNEAGPVWTAQFADVELWSFWFTNLLPWGFGPGFALWGIAGMGALLWRGGRAGPVTAVSGIAYYLVAAQTSSPFMRYALPLIPRSRCHRGPSVTHWPAARARQGPDSSG